ncbi:ribosomal protein L16- L13 family [Apiospora arundinis]|uniref:Cellulose-binding protein n=1 Tax=Apiospora arundinis TaxID=335852 RepID=A0ABR2HNW0_9PEZI
MASLAPLRRLVPLLCLLGTSLASSLYPADRQCATARYAHKHRVFIATDISNEPDDQMSLVRFLTYANELDLRGIAVVTSVWKNDSLDTASVLTVLDAYANVTALLDANVPETAPYPRAADLRAMVHEAHPVYGLAALELPPSEAALALVAAADAAAEKDPLYVTLWGGAGVLAEALHHVSGTRSADDAAALVRKLRVYAISDQDDAGAWLRVQYPSLFYVVALHGFSEYTQASWNGISGEAYRHFDKGGPDTSLVTNDWLETHIRRPSGSHSDLGAHYPKFEYIMEGDTPSFFPLLQNGLGDPEHPEWGSWGGRFLRVDASGRYPVYSDASDVAIGVNGEIYVSAFAGIWRWRAAYQHDFAARMQWTVTGDAAQEKTQNNHAPVVVVNGTCGPDVMKLSYQLGEAIVLDASQSWDPDSDGLTFDWFHYREVTSRMQEGVITKVSEDIAVKKLDQAGGLVSLEPLKNQTMHIILSVADEKEMPLTTYRRIILTPEA